MANVNKVILIGRTTSDLELRYTPKGTAVVNVDLAINRKSKEKEDEVVFVRVTFWGKTAETLAEYVEKGTQLFVEGRLINDSYTDKDSGKTFSRLSIWGDHFQFTEPKKQYDQEKENNDSDNSDIPF